MSDNCLNCGGLIMEIGISYGYAGKICYCPKNPEHVYQRPASKQNEFPHITSDQFPTEIEAKNEMIITLKSQLAQCKTKLEVAVEALEFYGSMKSWTYDLETMRKRCIMHDSEEKYDWSGGKKAREALEKLRAGKESEK